MSEEEKKKRQDTRISAYPHTLEEVLEKALQVPPPDGKKRRAKKPIEENRIGHDQQEGRSEP